MCVWVVFMIFSFNLFWLWLLNQKKYNYKEAIIFYHRIAKIQKRNLLEKNVIHVLKAFLNFLTHLTPFPLSNFRCFKFVDIIYERSQGFLTNCNCSRKENCFFFISRHDQKTVKMHFSSLICPKRWDCPKSIFVIT